MSSNDELFAFNKDTMPKFIAVNPIFNMHNEINDIVIKALKVLSIDEFKVVIEAAISCKITQGI